MMLGTDILGYLSICRIGVVSLLFFSSQACVIAQNDVTKDEKVLKTMKTNIARPEPVLFLEMAAEAMENYKKKNMSYPKEWHQLEKFSFSGGPYYVGDEGTKAKVEDGNTWKPKDCNYVYVIVSADNEEYKIVAINDENQHEYELTQAMKTPKLLLEDKAVKPTLTK